MRPRGGQHASASGRIAREAAIYPFELCRAILEGCRNQLGEDGKPHNGMHGLQGLSEGGVSISQWNVAYLDAITGEELDGEEATAAENVFSMKDNDVVIKDSVAGEPLELALVKVASKLEVE